MPTSPKMVAETAVGIKTARFSSQNFCDSVIARRCIFHWKILHYPLERAQKVAKCVHSDLKGNSKLDSFLMENLQIKMADKEAGVAQFIL
jgi:hypothetical protein